MIQRNGDVGHILFRATGSENRRPFVVVVVVVVLLLMLFTRLLLLLTVQNSAWGFYLRFSVTSVLSWCETEI